MEVIYVLTPNISSLADVSDSKWIGSSDNSNTKLCVDDTKSEYSVSTTLLFAVAMRSSRWSFTKSLVFRNTLAPYRKVSRLSIMVNKLS